MHSQYKCFLCTSECKSRVQARSRTPAFLPRLKASGWQECGYSRAGAAKNPRVLKRHGFVEWSGHALCTSRCVCARCVCDLHFDSGTLHALIRKELTGCAPLGCSARLATIQEGKKYSLLTDALFARSAYSKSTCRWKFAHPACPSLFVCGCESSRMHHRSVTTKCITNDLKYF